LVLVADVLVVAETLQATDLLTANTVEAVAVQQLLHKVKTVELALVHGIQVAVVVLLLLELATLLEVVLEH
jgi:hypothetical protein